MRPKGLKLEAELFEPSTPDKSDQTPNIAQFVDERGELRLFGEAVLHPEGMQYTDGPRIQYSIDDFEKCNTIGEGQFGVVTKVIYKPTQQKMAMKEIRLDLDPGSVSRILTELDVLYKSTSEYIIKFYGAFFAESCVYYLMEIMDGSIDRFYGMGVPEDILGHIALAVVRGLKYLKDHLNIIHRDVKPTNILVDRSGDVKLCDFGVSGKLIRSIAKTNVGCQSYMAPERIMNANQGTYTASSDVFSLGVTLFEIATGSYPYPREKYDSVFAQLNAIVREATPELPSDRFSQNCRDFVTKCLEKDPQKRPNYNELLAMPWLVECASKQADMKAWMGRKLNLSTHN